MRVKVYPESDQDPIAIAEIEGSTDADRLKHLQHLVGGHVEPIHTPRLSMKSNVALVDEDARYKGRRANYRATSAIGYPTALFGAVVVLAERPHPSGVGLTWGDINE